MAEKIALITDSTCDIPADWLQQFDIVKVPLTIIWNNETFLDGVDITPEEFYDRLAKDPQIPTTSQPTPQDFVDRYIEAEAKGYDQILVMTISSAMSGTYLSAKLAAENSPIPVQVVDSRSNSMGLGWQVINAARTRNAGAGIKEMIAAAEKIRSKIAYYISLDTIKYLDKGGRIGDAVKLLNSIIKIKPLILVNHTSGTVGASVPARSRSSAIEGLIKQFFKHVNTNFPLHITVLHNAADQEAEALADRIRKEYNPAELFVSIVSPILGVHTGPRAIALCGYSEEN